jgi:hypothetical protein
LAKTYKDENAIALAECYLKLMKKTGHEAFPHLRKEVHEMCNPYYAELVKDAKAETEQKKEKSFEEEMQSNLPSHYTNWEGVLTKIEWPEKFKVIARCGDVFFLKMSKRVYKIVHGLSVSIAKNQYEATTEFSQCCLHQAECHGMLD